MFSEQWHRNTNKEQSVPQKYYERLGISPKANPDEIHRAFRELAAKHHPDHGGDTAIFQSLSEAFSVLKDPEKRAMYDHQTLDIRQNIGEATQETGISRVDDTETEYDAAIRKANESAFSDYGPPRDMASIWEDLRNTRPDEPLDEWRRAAGERLQQ